MIEQPTELLRIWVELDPRTLEPITPQGLGLLGKSYKTMFGETVKIIATSCLFPTDHVTVQVQDGKRKGQMRTVAIERLRGTELF